MIDTANGDGGPWPAGDNATKSSMERIDPTAPDSDGNWGTNDRVTRNGLDAHENPINGTPKQRNSVTRLPSPTVTPTSTTSSTPGPIPTATATGTSTATVTPTATPVSPGSVVINEVVTDPQTDWSTTGFDGRDGGGPVTQGVDEWIELLIKASGLDLTGWTGACFRETAVLRMPR